MVGGVWLSVFFFKWILVLLAMIDIKGHRFNQASPSQIFASSSSYIWLILHSYFDFLSFHKLNIILFQFSQLILSDQTSSKPPRHNTSGANLHFLPSHTIN
jgi:hypothetical protein